MHLQHIFSFSLQMQLFLAESEGFEPPEQLLVQQISNLPRSTTPTTFQNIKFTPAIIHKTEFFVNTRKILIKIIEPSRRLKKR